MIRRITSADAKDILKIYALGLETRNATFETKVPSWETWDQKFHKHSRIVFADNGEIQGWAGITPFSNREVYKGVAEVSIYVHPDYIGKGIGSQLMKKLIKSSEENGIWTLFSSVFPENEATIKLHTRNNFKLLGRREKIAKLDGNWRDTLIFERRSKITGID
ncbi:N-acetyltransferase family protein [Christiangramia sp. SM2212]|uniref:N-acetyltransferase family protein n=1 Tax=Christiangramia sediminicola TaxID=3073267 RepID=A0ABU1EPQ2_9FLAO|nr:N-acetyltransferase family protein [Christiangramia sp. SM2212]MDR5590366.1 N-acetyltransferase family protein [Christiangramia sp. SM2212]